MVETLVDTQTRLGDPMLPQPYRIERIIKESYDTFTVEITPEDEYQQFAFEPGQFNMLYIFGVGEIPISISGDTARPNPIVHTTRAVGTVTRAMSQLKVGDTIGLRGPFGTSWPLKAARGQDLVLVAGGIGLPPLRPVLYHILNHREDYGKVVLLYGTRSPEDILFRKELESWRARFDFDVHVTVDYAHNEWYGNVGVVTTLIPGAPFDPTHTIAMTCGPEVMMRFVAAALLKRGVSPERIYVSMERNMKCAVGLCGHCQFGPLFICRDGPIFAYPQIENWINRWEV